MLTVMSMVGKSIRSIGMIFGINMRSFAVLALIICGCNVPNGMQVSVDTNAARAFVAGQLAFHTSEVGGDSVPDKPDPQSECTCKGTKRVVINDGGNKRVVQCPCGESCTCSGHKPKESKNEVSKKPVQSNAPKTAAGEKTNRLIYIWSHGCDPCKKTEETQFPALRKSGWTIGTEPDTNIQSIVWDDADAYIESYKIEAAPCFLHVVKGEVVKVRKLRDGEQYIPFQDIAALLNGTPESAAKTKVASPVNAYIPVSSHHYAYDTPWTRGEMIQHLQNEHKVRLDLSGYSDEDLLILHDLRHEGKVDRNDSQKKVNKKIGEYKSRRPEIYGQQYRVTVVQPRMTQQYYYQQPTRRQGFFSQMFSGGCPECGN